MEADNQIKLRFNNPILEKVDSITIDKSELDSLRMNKNGPTVVIISFFHECNDSKYLINLHVDNNYKVRTVHVSNFLLRAGDKLFI